MSPIASVNAVNVYKGLFYNAWNLGSATVSVSPGVPARSGKVYIVTTGVTSQTLRGTPTLTVDYPGSKVVAFDIQNFYFGCTLPLAQNNVNLATQCSILVAGFDENNREKAVATFTFTPIATKLTNSPMILASLPAGFKDLHNVTIVQSSPLNQVLHVDDIKYTTYSS